VGAVKPDRLGDELTNRPSLRRERRRQLTRSWLGPPRHAALLGERGKEAGQGARERLERTPDLPARAISLADRVRDRSNLDSRHACKRARAQHGEPLHPLDSQAVRLGATRPADGSARADRQSEPVGKCGADGSQELPVWLDSLELEGQREAALSERLDVALRDLEAWRADEAAFARMEQDDVDTLRRIGFATKQPPEDARVRLENQIAEVEAELAESRRRRRAFERYAEALE